MYVKILYWYAYRRFRDFRTKKSARNSLFFQPTNEGERHANQIGKKTDFKQQNRLFFDSFSFEAVQKLSSNKICVDPPPPWDSHKVAKIY